MFQLFTDHTEKDTRINIRSQTSVLWPSLMEDHRHIPTRHGLVILRCGQNQAMADLGQVDKRVPMQQLNAKALISHLAEKSNGLVWPQTPWQRAFSSSHK